MDLFIPVRPDDRMTYGTWLNRQHVTAGAGALDTIVDEIDRTGARKVFLFTTTSLVREVDLLARVRALIGDRLVGEFTQCRPHTPRGVVLTSAELVREAQPDLLVSFGGSTVTDTAKAVNFALANGIDTYADFDPVDLARDPHLGPPAPLLPHIAIPTTLSGAEFSAYAGITDEAKQVKRVYTQLGMAPVAVILDVETTRATPDPLWTSTGIKSMSDAFELVCSPLSHPFTQVLARSAIETFRAHLPASVADDAGRVTSRTYCQHATWLSAYSLANSTSKLGLGSGFRHQLGAMGIAHGQATCIMLPHLIAFSWPDLGGSRKDLAAALGMPAGLDDADAGADVAAHVSAFIAGLGQGGGLADVGVTKEDIPGLAERIAADPATALSVRAATVDDLEALLLNAL